MNWRRLPAAIALAGIILELCARQVARASLLEGWFGIAPPGWALAAAAALAAVLTVRWRSADDLRTRSGKAPALFAVHQERDVEDPTWHKRRERLREPQQQPGAADDCKINLFGHKDLHSPRMLWWGKVYRPLLHGR